MVAERARRVAHFPALKIKVGGPADIETLEAVRGVYGGPLRVDANTGWQPEQAVALIPELERLGVELVEQPFPARALPQLRWLRERSSLPILADESAVFETDLEMLDGVVDGVVVKLAKCGGIGPALRMIRRARQLGMKVMLGCMVESSLGVAAAAMVASRGGLARPGRQPAAGRRPLRRARAGRRLPLAALDGARPGRRSHACLTPTTPSGWASLDLPDGTVWVPAVPMWTTSWTSSWTTR